MNDGISLARSLFHVLIDIVTESCHYLVSLAVLELSKTGHLRTSASLRWYMVNPQVLNTYGSVVSQGPPAVGWKVYVSMVQVDYV